MIRRVLESERLSTWILTATLPWWQVVLRGWHVVQQAPSIPNLLSVADMDLLRTRVDQRG